MTALRSRAGSENRDKRNPARAGLPWNDEEDEVLLSAFNNGATIGALADKHERTYGAIKSPREARPLACARERATVTGSCIARWSGRLTCLRDDSA